MKEYTFNYGIEPDHSKFIRIGSNRDPKTQHSHKIAESIKQKMNLLGANPIIVANGFIIDGQHRHQACEYLGIPVPYIEVFGMTDEEMITAMHTLNSNAKNWGLADYLKLYCKKGYQNYLDLDTFMKDYELSISIAIYIIFHTIGLIQFNMSTLGVHPVNLKNFSYEDILFFASP
jgi:hypothetical protein